MTAPALQLPEAWAGPDGRMQIPGCTKVREVAGARVYTIHGESYLSTGGVLKLSPWGRIDHVHPAALEYGRARGAWVDEACRLYDEGCLDWDGTAWEQTFDGKRMNLRPFVEAYATWRQTWNVPTETEVLIVQPGMRTFGYIDRRLKAPGYRLVVDLKTSAVITDRERLQVASYLTGDDRGLILQLGKDGKPHEHWLSDQFALGKRFETLAVEAHRWLEQQDAR